MAMEKCPKCKSKNIEKGIILTGKPNLFKADRQELLATGHEFRPFACLDCGYIELQLLEPEALKKEIGYSKK
ncbi:MAG: hypothetical protein QXK06_03465 [Candidatus Diapherotrites archaeon]